MGILDVNRAVKYSLFFAEKTREYAVPQQPNYEWLHTAIFREETPQMAQKGANTGYAISVAETMLGITPNNCLSEGEIVAFVQPIIAKFPAAHPADIIAATSLYCAGRICAETPQPIKLSSKFMVGLMTEYYPVFHAELKKCEIVEAKQSVEPTPFEIWEQTYTTYCIALKFDFESGDALGVADSAANAIDAMCVLCFDAYARAGYKLYPDTMREAILAKFKTPHAAKVATVRTWIEVALATQNATCIAQDYETFTELMSAKL